MTNLIETLRQLGCLRMRVDVQSAEGGGEDVVARVYARSSESPVGAESLLVEWRAPVELFAVPRLAVQQFVEPISYMLRDLLEAAAKRDPVAFPKRRPGTPSELRARLRALGAIGDEIRCDYEEGTFCASAIFRAADVGLHYGTFLRAGPPRSTDREALEALVADLEARPR